LKQMATCRYVTAMVLSLTSLGAAAQVEEVAPEKIAAYVKAHRYVFVQFISPDKGCTFCIGADKPFEQTATQLKGQMPVARVQWSPWAHFPAEIKPVYSGRGIPIEIVYKDGKAVHQISGKIVDVPAVVAALKDMISSDQHVPPPSP
jgi:hypothetical protein